MTTLLWLAEMTLLFLLVMGLVVAGASLAFLRLPKDAGAEVSGHDEM